MVDKDSLNTLMRIAGMEEYPNEACGLVVAVGKKSIAIKCKNVSPEPESRFTISASDYADACERGEVIAVWHTHTDESAEPSDGDKVSCEETGLPWFILGLHKVGDDFEFYGPTVTEPSGFEMPYLGRPYISGALDCYSLLVDFYKREYGVRINNYPRIEEDGTMGFSFFVERFSDEGFVRLFDQEPQRGDVFFLMTESKFDTPNHIAIYLGDDAILHHCHGRLSRRDLYGASYWQKHTTHHLRHKSKC